MLPTLSAKAAPLLLEPLPSFKGTAGPGCRANGLCVCVEVPKDVWPRLVSQKLAQVKVLCEFGPEASSNDARNREVKSQALGHLVEYLAPKPEGFSEANYPVLIEVFSRNALRPVPPATNPVGDEFDPEEDEDVLERSWPHLNLVYDMFIKFLELPDFNAPLARRHIDHTFVVRLMALFDVEDPRERDLVKTTLHRVYGKFLHLRPVIRKLMRSVFMEVVCENVRHKIAEMLEILGSVINGFALPIRDEHRVFLEKSLVPLHKARTLPCFFQQLCFCVTQYVEKDPSMARIIVPGLVRIWPKTNTTKEVLFLSELEEILLRLDPEDFEPIAGLVYERLGRCLASQHFQVAEKTLMFWHNEDMIDLLLSQPVRMIQILTPHLLHHSVHHWNANVRTLIIGVIHIFIEINGPLFEHCAEEYAAAHHLDPVATRMEVDTFIHAHICTVSGPAAVAGEGMTDERMAGDVLVAGEKMAGEKMAGRKMADEAGVAPAELDSSPQAQLVQLAQLAHLTHLAVPSVHTGPALRRKSVLPTDLDVAAALANYRPSPPPAPLPTDE